MVQAQNPQEESQRMLAVRKVFQKAIVTPTHHVEQHWRDYENFENSVSRALVTFLFQNFNSEQINFLRAEKGYQCSKT